MAVATQVQDLTDLRMDPINRVREGMGVTAINDTILATEWYN